MAPAPASLFRRFFLLGALGLGRLGATTLPGDIDMDRELVIRDTAIVDSADAEPGHAGRFAFETLLQGIAGPGGNAKIVLLDWLHAWAADPAGSIDPGAKLIREWKYRDTNGQEPTDANWTPDFRHAPFRLLAIVNRLDLQNRDPVTHAPKNAGEGRFVFCLTGGTDVAAAAQQATVIFEYELAARTEAEVLDWAQAWHRLGTFTLNSTTYRDELAKLTARFTAAGVAPGRPNGSALRQIRTNEMALSGLGSWKLREFNFSPQGRLAAATTKQTPPDALWVDPQITTYINTHEPDILQHQHEVTPSLLGYQASLPGTRDPVWTPPHVNNPVARYLFARNTCNGCHGAEGGGEFTHIDIRERGAPSGLSAFLRPGQAPVDPATRTPHPELQEIAYRQLIMAQVLNGLWVQSSGHWTLQEMAVPPAPDKLKTLLDLLAPRANRVH